MRQTGWTSTASEMAKVLVYQSVRLMLVALTCSIFGLGLFNRGVFRSDLKEDTDFVTELRCPDTDKLITAQ